MKAIRIILRILYGFVGIGAIAGGTAAIADPVAPMDAPLSMLENSPFDTFLVPGILLAAVIGAGNIFALVISLWKPRATSYTGCVTGTAMVIWIVVQCIMLRSVVSLHVIFFFVGVAQGVLGLTLLFHNRQFPASFIVRCFGRR